MSLNNQKGIIKVWRHDFDGNDGKKVSFFSTTVSSKDEEGNYINASLPVNFSNSVDVDQISSGCDFEVEDGWLSSYVSKKYDYPQIKLFVNKGSVISKSQSDEDKLAMLKEKMNNEFIEKTQKVKTKALKDKIKKEIEQKYADDLKKLSLPF